MEATVFVKQTIRGNVAYEEGCILLAMDEDEYKQLKDRLDAEGFKEVAE